MRRKVFQGILLTLLLVGTGFAALVPFARHDVERVPPFSPRYVHVPEDGEVSAGGVTVRMLSSSVSPPEETFRASPGETENPIGRRIGRYEFSEELVFGTLKGPVTLAFEHNSKGTEQKKASLQRHETGPVAKSGGDWRLGDVDKDGLDEWVHLGGGVLTVLDDTAHGNAPLFGPTPRAGKSILLADADGDGAMEIVLATEGEIRVLDDALSRFRDLARVTVGSGAPLALRGAGDLDGDGTDELLWQTSRAPLEIGVLKLTGALLQDVESTAIPWTTDGLAVLGNFDKDWPKEVAFVGRTPVGSRLVVYDDLRSGLFEKVRVDRSDLPGVGSRERFVVAADLDGDYTAEILHGATQWRTRMEWGEWREFSYSCGSDGSRGWDTPWLFGRRTLRKEVPIIDRNFISWVRYDHVDSLHRRVCRPLENFAELGHLLPPPEDWKLTEGDCLDGQLGKLAYNHLDPNARPIHPHHPTTGSERLEYVGADGVKDVGDFISAEVSLKWHEFDYLCADTPPDSPLFKFDAPREFSYSCGSDGSRGWAIPWLFGKRVLRPEVVTRERDGTTWVRYDHVDSLWRRSCRSLENVGELALDLPREEDWKLTQGDCVEGQLGKLAYNHLDPNAQPIHAHHPTTGNRTIDYIRMDGVHERGEFIPKSLAEAWHEFDYLCADVELDPKPHTRVDAYSLATSVTHATVFEARESRKLRGGVVADLDRNGDAEVAFLAGKELLVVDDAADGAAAMGAFGGARDVLAGIAGGLTLAAGNVDGDGFVIEYIGRGGRLDSIIPMAALSAPPTVAGISQNRDFSGMDVLRTRSESESRSAAFGGKIGLGVGFTINKKVMVCQGLAVSTCEFEFGVRLKIDVESEVTAVHGTESSWSYEFGLGQGGGADEDVVVFATVPRDVYKYRILASTIPESPAGGFVTIELPRAGGVTVANVIDFNALNGDAPDIGAETFSHVIGDPGTYPTTAWRDALLSKALAPIGYSPVSKESQGFLIGIGTGVSKSVVAIGDEEGNSTEVEHSVEVTFSKEIKLGIVDLDLKATGGFVHVHSWTATTGTGIEFSGAIGSIQDRYEWFEHKYVAGPMLYWQRWPGLPSGFGLYVFHWWVDDYRGIPVWEPVTDAPVLREPFDGAEAYPGVQFNVSRVAYAKRYQFQIAADPEFNRVLSSAVQPGDSFNLAPSLPNGVYHWRARGISGNFEAGPWSDSRTVAVGGVPRHPPSAITVGSGSVSWGAVDYGFPAKPAEGYDVLVALAAAPHLVFIQARLGPVLSWTVPAGLAPAEYVVQVRGVNPVGAGPWSAPEALTVRAPPGPPPEDPGAGLVAFNLGAGATTGPLSERRFVRDLPPAWAVSAGDVDSDGKPELLVLARDVSRRSPAVLLDDAQEGYRTMWAFDDADASAVLLADVDGDGAAEVVLASARAPFNLTVYDDWEHRLALLNVSSNEVAIRHLAGGQLDQIPGDEILAAPDRAVCDVDHNVRLYERKDFRGGCFGLSHSVDDLRGLTFDNGKPVEGAISSLVAKPGVQVALKRAGFSSGPDDVKWVAGPVGNLGSGYDNRINSITLRTDGPCCSEPPPPALAWVYRVKGHEASREAIPPWQFAGCGASKPHGVPKPEAPAAPETHGTRAEWEAFRAAERAWIAAEDERRLRSCIVRADAAVPIVLQADGDPPLEVAWALRSDLRPGERAARGAIAFRDDFASPAAPPHFWGEPCTTVAKGKMRAAAGDWDGNGAAAVACLGDAPGGSLLTVTEPRPGQTPASARIVELNLEGAVGGIAFGDADGDGKADLVVATIEAPGGDVSAHYRVLAPPASPGAQPRIVSEWWSRPVPTLTPDPEPCCPALVVAAVGPFTPGPPEGEIALGEPMNLDSGAVNLTWRRPAQATDRSVRLGAEWSYRVLVARDTAFSDVVLNVTVPAPKLTTPILAPGDYHVSVAGTNGAGWTPANATTFEALGPLTDLKTRPKPVSPILRESAPTRPTLTWEPLEGAVRYNVELVSDDHRDEPIEGVSEAAAWTAPRELLPDAVYVWRVQGVSSRGAISPWSSPQAFVTTREGAAMDAPVAFASVRATTGTPVLPLQWNRVAGAMSYRVEYAAASDFENPVLTANVDASPHAPKDLPAGSYFARVRGVASGGDGPWGNPVPIRVGQAPSVAPTLKANVSEKEIPTGPGPSEKVTLHLPPVTWEAVAGATDYVVQLSTTRSFATTVNQWETKDRGYDAADLAGGEYWMRARATDEGAEGPWSEPLPFLAVPKSGPGGLLGIPAPGAIPALLALAAAAALAAADRRRG